MFDSYNMPIRPSGIMLVTTDKNVLKKSPVVYAELDSKKTEEPVTQGKSVIELLLIIAGLK